MPDKKTYKTNSGVYEISDKEASEFLSDFPDAVEVESFVFDKDTFDIPINDVDEFLSDIPKAKPLKKKDDSETSSKDSVSQEVESASSLPTRSKIELQAEQLPPLSIEQQAELEQSPQEAATEIPLEIQDLQESSKDYIDQKNAEKLSIQETAVLESAPTAASPEIPLAVQDFQEQTQQAQEFRDSQKLSIQQQVDLESAPKGGIIEEAADRPEFDKKEAIDRIRGKKISDIVKSATAGIDDPNELKFMNNAVGLTEVEYRDGGTLSPGMKLMEYSRLTKPLEEQYLESINNQEYPTQEQRDNYVESLKAIAGDLGLNIDKYGSPSILEEDQKRYKKALESNMNQIDSEFGKTAPNGFAKDVSTTLAAGLADTYAKNLDLMGWTLGLNAIPGYENLAAGQRFRADDIRDQVSRKDLAITDAVQEGEYGKAFGNAILQMTESAPMLAQMWMTGGGSSASLASMGLLEATGRYEETPDHDGSMVSYLAKLIDATAYGTFEAVPEAYGTGAVMNMVKRRAKAGVSKKLLSEGIGTIYANQYHKAASLLSEGVVLATTGGLDEVATGMGQNVLDGKNPTDRIGDMFIVGTLMDVAMASPLLLSEGVPQAKETARVLANDIVDRLPKTMATIDKIRAGKILMEKDGVKKESDNLDDSFKGTKEDTVEDLDNAAKLTTLSKEDKYTSSNLNTAINTELAKENPNPETLVLLNNKLSNIESKSGAVIDKTSQSVIDKALKGNTPNEVISTMQSIQDKRNMSYDKAFGNTDSKFSEAVDKEVKDKAKENTKEAVESVKEEIKKEDISKEEPKVEQTPTKEEKVAETPSKEPKTDIKEPKVEPKTKEDEKVLQEDLEEGKSVGKEVAKEKDGDGKKEEVLEDTQSGIKEAKKTDVIPDKVESDEPKVKPITEKVEESKPEDDKAKASQKKSIEKIGDISKKEQTDLLAEAESLQEIQHLMQIGKVKFGPEFNKRREELVKENKLDDDASRIKNIDSQMALQAKPDYSKEISKKVDEDLKTKKEKLTDKEEATKERLNTRLQNLSGAKFALKEGEKSPDVLKEIVGVVGDLAELGIIQLEKGMDHISTKLKEYLSNIDPENIDKYRDDIAEAYNVKKPKPVSEPFKTQAEADKETDRKAKLTQEQTPLSLSEPTWWDDFVTKVQNKYRRVDKLVEAAKKGQDISDEIDPSLQIELMSGKAIKKTKDKSEEVLKGKPKGKKSLADRARKDGVDLETLGTYMTAKHAPERNNQKLKERDEYIDKKIASLNERIEQAEDPATIERLEAKKEAFENERIKQEEVDILNKKAEAYVEKIESNKKADKYKQYSEEVLDILIKARQEALVEYGLVDQKLIDELNEMYPNYVPYHVLSKQEGKQMSGQKRIDVRGRDIFKANSLIDIESKDRTNPITQALLNYYETVIRGEKNMANQSLMNFAEQVDNDLIEVIHPKSVKMLNDEGFMERVAIGLEGVPENERINLKVDGKPVVLHIKDKALMRAMSGSGTMRSINGLNQINNYLRFVNTLYNPEFVLTNLTRDLQTAAINISAEDVKGIKRKFAKNLPNAMGGIWQNEQGNLNSEWSKIVEELRDLGGEVGWLNTENIEELNNRLTKQFNKYNHDKVDTRLKTALNTAAHYIESVNKTVEMASRVAAYKAAIDSGVSKQQAARLAKNLTVNFNKKGELGSLMDSLYLFANAGIQGSAILMKNVAISGNVRMLASGIVLGSMMLNHMNYAINGDEYEKISDGIKERNLIIMHKSGNYNKIPLPYGYNIFKVLGDKMYEVSIGRKRSGDASIEMFQALMNAFNPISSSDLTQTLSPTVVDPFVQVSSNKNWFGGEIKPSQPPYGAKVPESTLFFNSVRPTSKKISKQVNELTGGTASVSGKVDISPEYIDHFTDFVSGGLGRFVMNFINSVGGAIRREEVSVSNIPFYRQYAGTVSEKADLGIIYGTLKDSWVKEFNKVEKEKFNKSLSKAMRNRLITPEDFAGYKEDFIKGQISVRMSKNNPDLTREQLKRRLK